MSKDNKDDIGFGEYGQIIAVGDEAAHEGDYIITHPDSQPVMIIAQLRGHVGIRVYGPPDERTALLLDQIATTYRKALEASKARTH